MARPIRQSVAGAANEISAAARGSRVTLGKIDELIAVVTRVAVATEQLVVAIKEHGIKMGAEALGHKIPASVTVSTNETDETDETKKDSGS